MPGTHVHPTALVAPEVELGQGVSVGPFAVIEGRVQVGDHCVIKAHAQLVGPLKLGRRNQVFQGAILGESPQHLKYNGEPTSVEIGDDNVFREHVTVHRGFGEAGKTIIGCRNYLMVNSHVGHDSRVGNQCILANGALIAGHCVLEDCVFLSGNCALHQHVRVGRLALLSGISGTTKDIPPFVLQQGIDTVVGINVIGMRRAGMSNEQIQAVRQAFKILFREGLPVPAAIERLDEELGEVDAVQELITFLHGSKRGISPMRERFRETAA